MFFSDLDKMCTFCSDDFVCQTNSDLSTSDQVGGDVKFHIRRDFQERVH